MNLLYINELFLLKGTKETVNEKVLDDKKGNALTNAFSFFFGGSDDKKNESYDYTFSHNYEENHQLM